MADVEKIKVAYQKAYGDFWETKYAQDMAARSKDDVNEKSEPVKEQAETVHEAPEAVQTAEVQETVQVQEAPAAVQEAFMPEKEEKAYMVKPDDKAKDDFPSLFSMFTEMMGGENQGGDDELAAMFALAFSALLGEDKFKERLEEAERKLEEMRKREQEKENVEKAPAAAEKEPVKAEKEPVKAEKEPVAAELPSVKIKTPADMAYDKVAQGKEQVTLADLKQAGVNLKTDLQPTLKALTKDNPNKISELAPKGLGDEKVPVSKEFATALIARAQQREAISRHNGLSR